MTRPSIEEYRARPAPPERRSGSNPLPAATGDLPRISVVTAVWNARQELPRTLDSIFGQEYPALEHVVVDGGSRDGTVEMLAAEPRIARWISEPDRGIYDAMNKGIALATGDLVGLINAGDRYHPGSFAAAARAYREHGDGCIYYGDQIADYVDLGLRVELRSEPRLFKRKMSVCHESVFIPRRLYEEIGLHDLAYTIAADYELLAGEHFRGRPFVYLGQPVAVFESGGASWHAFARYRRELVAFHRRERTGHLVGAALFAAWEVALVELHRLGRPLLGRKLADRLRRWFFRKRG